AWAGRLVQAVVEVLAGARPVGQLVRWTSSDVYDEVAGLVLVRTGSGGPEQARAMVRSVHVTEPADGVAEVAAMVRRGVRTTAVALRLEGLDGRWQCTALELG
ncbi:MAG TPA: Rv3235 family protein, partial [Actinomycetes bacterium]